MAREPRTTASGRPLSLQPEQATATIEAEVLEPKDVTTGQANPNHGQCRPIRRDIGPDHRTIWAVLVELGRICTLPVAVLYTSIVLPRALNDAASQRTAGLTQVGERGAQASGSGFTSAYAGTGFDASS